MLLLVLPIAPILQDGVMVVRILSLVIGAK